MDVCPAARAVLYFDCEKSEDKEEAGHPKADFVDGRVTHQLFTIHTGLHVFTQVLVEGNLREK